jgi:membrane-associated protease RseP (regulator of RpoE activity)
MTAWLIGCATLFLVLIIHECGHFLTAWAVGMRSRLIVIGLGPALLRYRAKKWEGRINVLPVVGWVELPEHEVATYLWVDGELVPVVCGGDRKPALWKHLLVFSAGPGANFLAALLLLSVAHADLGRMGRREKTHLDARWRKAPMHELTFELTYPMRNAAGPIGIVSAWATGTGTRFHSRRGWLHYAAACNACLALFNLLPIFPLDGGRFLGSIVLRIAPRLQQSRWTDRFLIPQLVLLCILAAWAVLLDIEHLWRRFLV